MGQFEQRWVAPPSWPQPPSGWAPREDWTPDPGWPPAPSYWHFWQPAYVRDRADRVALLVGVLLGLAAAVLLVMPPQAVGAGRTISCASPLFLFAPSDPTGDPQESQDWARCSVVMRDQADSGLLAVAAALGIPAAPWMGARLAGRRRRPTRREG